MSITIQDEHGADVEVFVRLRGGFVEVIVRAFARQGAKVGFVDMDAVAGAAMLSGICLFL